LANFFGLYEAIVDGWQTYDNTDLAGPRLIASRPNSGTRVIADPVAWQKLTVLPMTDPEARTPAERVNDVERITEALRQGVREALRKHKLLGNSVVTWRDGKVVWVPPDQIPDFDDG
jgi:hypothetical protein